MRSYVAPGQSVDITVTEAAFGEAGAVVGKGYVVQNLFGIAANNAAVGETATLHLTGVYELPAWFGIGDFGMLGIGWEVYFNTETGFCGIQNEGHYKIGVVVGKAPKQGQEGGDIQVRLDGVAVAAVPAVGP